MSLFRWVRGGAATSARRLLLERCTTVAVVGWCALLSGATLRLRIPPTARVKQSLFVALAQPIRDLRPGQDGG